MHALLGLSDACQVFCVASLSQAGKPFAAMMVLEIQDWGVEAYGDRGIIYTCACLVFSKNTIDV